MTELYIFFENEYKILDIDGETGLAYDFRVSDISLPFKRRGSSSKTITIPNTDNNANILYHLYDINNVTDFNPNKKTPCYLVQEGVNIFSGSLQLTSIEKLPNGLVKYKGVIYSELLEFFEEIENEFIEDIDLSGLGHTYSESVIVDSWQHDYNDGYTYPLIDYNSPNFDIPINSQNFYPDLGTIVEDFKPAIFVKYLFDRIFLEKGKFYQSNFLNSDLFKNLLIPYSQKEQLINSESLNVNNKIFIGIDPSLQTLAPPAVGPFTSQTAFFPTTTQIPKVYANYSARLSAPPSSSFETLVFLNAVGHNINSYDSLNLIYSYLPAPAAFGNGRIEYTDETTGSYGDAGNKWDTTLFEFTNGNVPLVQQFVVNFDVTIKNPFLYRSGTFSYSAQVATGSFMSNNLGDTSFDVSNKGNLIDNPNQISILTRVRREFDINGNPAVAYIPLQGYDYTTINSPSERYAAGILPFPNPLPISIPKNINGDWAFLYNTHQSSLNAPLDPSQKAIFDYTIRTTSSSGFAPGSPTTIDNTVLYEYDSIFKPSDIFTSLVGTSSSVNDFDRYVKVVKTIQLDGSTPLAYPLFNGEKVWVECVPVMNRYMGNFYHFNTDKIILEIGNSIKNEIQTKLLKNQTIAFNTIIPKKVKKIDFITSLAKMFNLYIDIDKLNPNKFIIEPRDDYYNLGTIKDWSKKVDIQKDVIQDLVADKQKKLITLSHKNDSDFLNKDYLDKIKTTYGAYLYSLENEFVKGEERIETIFSPSPLQNVFVSTDIIIPRILTQQTASGAIREYVGTNLRILQRNVNKVISTTTPWKFEGTFYNTYPYCGHFNHPLTGTSDINFGTTEGLYYPGNKITSNNLYNNYWRRTFLELYNKDSRLVKLYVNLTTQDLSELNLYDTIYIENTSFSAPSYFRINQLTYNSSFKDSYEIELFKIIEIDYQEFVDNSPKYLKSLIGFNTTDNGSKPGKIEVGVNKSEGSFMTFIMGDNNESSFGGKSFIFGDTNNISPLNRDNVVFGNNNYIKGFSNESIVIGSNNIIENSENSIIIGGSNNTIKSDNSVIINGNGEYVDSDNVTKIGGILIKGTNFISASTDEVLNPFSDGIINYISGSVDAVRNLGSFENINIISGGLDRV